MRTRTIVFSLLAIYALFATAYFSYHFWSANGLSGGRTPSTADTGLPVAPPFNGGKPSVIPNEELLARVEIENELTYTDLQSFICNEQMNRYRGRLNGENPRQIDTVTARVSFENGVENYSAILQNNRERENMYSIPGAWSVGEFGTLLRQTRTLLASQPLSFRTATSPTGEAASLYTLQVPGVESPWELIVSKEKYRVPFQTDVLVSQTTGRILNIKRTSTAMPPDFGISEIEWSVNLRPMPLDGKEYLLPISGQYSILYQKSNRREWNDIAFSNYHRYTASSTMHF